MTTQLHEQRLALVMDLLVHGHARRVIDLGCGRGDLLKRLVACPQFEKIVGIDTCVEALAEAQRDLPLEEIVCGRLTLMYGSFAEGDPRQARFDAAVMLETIEHVDPRRLSGVERFVFSQVGAPLVLITTPNREYNAVLGLDERSRRHAEHAFEWSRPRFEAWAKGVARRNGYSVEFGGVGDAHPALGSPSQVAIFHKLPDARRSHAHHASASLES
jgi:3' terminal RNA ribose 2'-O-methyltransferase Hen1